MTDLVDHYLGLRPLLRDELAISTTIWFDELESLVAAYAAADGPSRDAVDQIVRDPEQSRFLVFSMRAAERAVELSSPRLIDASIWSLVMAGLRRSTHGDQRDFDQFCPLPFKSAKLIGLDIRPRVAEIADEAGGAAREYLLRWSTNDAEKYFNSYGWFAVETGAMFEFQSGDRALVAVLERGIGPLDRQFNELRPALVFDPVVSEDVVRRVVELLRGYQQAGPTEKRSLEDAFRADESRAMRRLAKQFVEAALDERSIDWLELGLLALIVSTLQRPDRFDPADVAEDLTRIVLVAQRLIPEGLRAVRKVHRATGEPARQVLDKAIPDRD